MRTIATRRAYPRPAPIRAGSPPGRVEPLPCGPPALGATGCRRGTSSGAGRARPTRRSARPGAPAPPSWRRPSTPSVGPHVRVSGRPPCNGRPRRRAIIAEHLGAGPVTSTSGCGRPTSARGRASRRRRSRTAGPASSLSGQRPPASSRRPTCRPSGAGARRHRHRARGTARSGVVAHAGVLRAVRRHGGAVDEHLANLGGLWFAVEPGEGTVTFTGVFDPGRRAATADESRL